VYLFHALITTFQQLVANDPLHGQNVHALFTPENDVMGGTEEATNEQRATSQPILGTRDTALSWQSR